MSIEKETLFVSFSGGRTSGYMCWYLIKYWSHKYNFIFIFANTGQEHNKTLEFVDRCDKEFGLNLVWLEADVNPKEGKGTGFVIVDFETAKRWDYDADDAPYSQVASKYGLPGPGGWTHCNRELKIGPLECYQDSIGFSRSHPRAIGIRGDEIDRMSPEVSGKYVYPLVSMKMTNKSEILEWWGNQSFDLGIQEHEGNCLWCWKKSDSKLFTLAKSNPEYFKFPMKLDDEHRFSGAPQYAELFRRTPEGDEHIGLDKSYQIERRMFRGYRKTSDIIASSLDFDNEYRDKELQYGLDFEVDACGSESCEAF